MFSGLSGRSKRPSAVFSRLSGSSNRPSVVLTRLSGSSKGASAAFSHLSGSSKGPLGCFQVLSGSRKTAGEMAFKNAVCKDSTRLQSPPQHIEQITPVTQQHGCGGCQMLEVNGICLLHLAAGKGFHQLGNRQHTGRGIGMQHIKRGVSVNQQGGDGAVDSG